MKKIIIKILYYLLPKTMHKRWVDSWREDMKNNPAVNSKVSYFEKL